MLQRATDLAFLRALATKWGYAVYLEAENGRVVGHFHPLDPLADPQGELSLGFGGDALSVQAQAQLSAGHRVHAARIPPLSDTAQTGDSAGDDEAQGAELARRPGDGAADARRRHRRGRAARDRARAWRGARPSPRASPWRSTRPASA